MKDKVYIHIARQVFRYKDTSNSDIAWDAKSKIKKLIKDYLPSGAGIDTPVEIDLTKSTKNKLVFTGSYHRMDDNGMYSGWHDFSVVVVPSLTTGMDVLVKGANGARLRWEEKDYIGESFDICLMKEVEE